MVCRLAAMAHFAAQRLGAWADDIASTPGRPVRALINEGCNAVFRPTEDSNPAPASPGPLYAAIGGAVVAGVLLVVMLTRLTINFMTVLSVVIPAVTVAALLLAV